MDLNTTNAIVTARQETVQQMMASSRRPSDVISRVGSLLVRLGERLQRDVAAAPNAQPSVPTSKRPQLA